MTPKTSVVTNELCDVLTAQAMQNLPISPGTTLNIIELLRVVAADCAEMERRIAGEPIDNIDAPNVISFNRGKPAGGA